MSSTLLKFSRALGSAGCSTTRAMATMASGSGSSVKEPTYQYLPPGSSMREPVYISMSDPVYFYDVPPPAPSSTVGAPTAIASEEKAPAFLSKLPFTSISGAPKPDSKPVPYKMVDDMAQVPYVTSPNHSMREPKYVSIADPSYPQADRQQQQQQQQK